MKKVLLVLTLTLGALTINAQTKIKVDLKDGLGSSIPMTFVILDTNSVNRYLKTVDSISNKSTEKTNIKMFVELANMQLKFNMKNSISYKPIQSESNEIFYNVAKNRLEIILTAGAKNGYGNFIEDLHMIAFSNDSHYILGKLVF